MIPRHIIFYLMISLIFAQSVSADDFSLNILTYKNSPYNLLRTNFERQLDITQVTSQDNLKDITKKMADDLPFILSEAIKYAAKKATKQKGNLSKFREVLYLELSKESGLLASFYYRNINTYAKAVSEKYDKDKGEYYRSRYNENDVRLLMLSQFLNVEIKEKILKNIDVIPSMLNKIDYVNQNSENLDSKEVFAEYIFILIAKELIYEKE